MKLLIVITRNPKDFFESKIKVMSPAEFLDQIEKGEHT